MDANTNNNESDYRSEKNEICTSVSLVEKICNLNADDKAKFIEIISRTTPEVEPSNGSQIEALRLFFPDINERDIRCIKIGTKLKSLRQQRGLTQEILSAKTNICQTHISRIERFYLIPSKRTLESIAVALGVTPNEIDTSLSKSTIETETTVDDDVKRLFPLWEGK